MHRAAPRSWYILHDNHVHVTNDTRARVESRGQRRVLIGKQTMSNFVVLGRKLDENDLGRSPGLHPSEIHCVPLILFTDGGEFGVISSVDFAKEFEFWGTFDGLRLVRRGAWP